VGKDHRRRAKSRSHIEFPGPTSPQSLSSLLPRIGTQSISVLECEFNASPVSAANDDDERLDTDHYDIKIGPMLKGVICGMYFSPRPSVQYVARYAAAW
jgi:hypothetical protein